MSAEQSVASIEGVEHQREEIYFCGLKKYLAMLKAENIAKSASKENFPSSDLTEFCMDSGRRKDAAITDIKEVPVNSKSIESPSIPGSNEQGQLSKYIQEGKVAEQVTKPAVSSPKQEETEVQTQDKNEQSGMSNEKQPRRRRRVVKAKDIKAPSLNKKRAPIKPDDKSKPLSGRKRNSAATKAVELTFCSITGRVVNHLSDERIQDFIDHVGIDSLLVFRKAISKRHCREVIEELVPKDDGFNVGVDWGSGANSGTPERKIRVASQVLEGVDPTEWFDIIKKTPNFPYVTSEIGPKRRHHNVYDTFFQAKPSADSTTYLTETIVKCMLDNAGLDGVLLSPAVSIVNTHGENLKAHHDRNDYDGVGDTIATVVLRSAEAGRVILTYPQSNMPSFCFNVEIGDIWIMAKGSTHGRNLRSKILHAVQAYKPAKKRCVGADCDCRVSLNVRIGRFHS